MGDRWTAAVHPKAYDLRPRSARLRAVGPLSAGTNLTIVTGEDAVEGPGQVVWKRQNVWNDDGDVANLIGPATHMARAP